MAGLRPRDVDRLMLRDLLAFCAAQGYAADVAEKRSLRHAAMLMALYINAHADPKKHRRSLSPADVIPYAFDVPGGPSSAATLEAQEAAALAQEAAYLLALTSRAAHA